MRFQVITLKVLSACALMVMLASAHGQKLVPNAKHPASKPKIAKGTRRVKPPVSKPTILSKNKQTEGTVDSIVGDEPMSDELVGDAIPGSRTLLPDGVTSGKSIVKPLMGGDRSDGPLTNAAQEAESTAAEGSPDEVGGQPEKPGPKRDGPSVGVS